MLAAFAVACALVARPGARHPWAAGGLVIGVGLGVGLLGAASGGNSDVDGWILLANVAARGLWLPLGLLLWWVLSGARPRPVRAAATWTGSLLLGAILGNALDNIADYVTVQLRLDGTAEFNPSSLPGLVVIAVVLAVAVGARSARGDRAGGPAGDPAGAPGRPEPLPATGD